MADQRSEPNQEPTEANEERTQPDEHDTEGHYLASYEYGRTVARERQQEADRIAREAQVTRERRPAKKR